MAKENRPGGDDKPLQMGMTRVSKAPVREDRLNASFSESTRSPIGKKSDARYRPKPDQGKKRD